MGSCPLQQDFKVPDAIQRLITGTSGTSGTAHPNPFTDDVHPGNKALNDSGRFEFFFGPAGAGAWLHQHAAAWNGLVHGRKRWLLLPPGKLQGSPTLPAGRVPTSQHPFVSSGRGAHAKRTLRHWHL